LLKKIVPLKLAKWHFFEILKKLLFQKNRHLLSSSHRYIHIPLRAKIAERSERFCEKHLSKSVNSASAITSWKSLLLKQLGVMIVLESSYYERWSPEIIKSLDAS